MIGSRSADEPSDERRPAGGRADHLTALDPPARRLHGDDAVAVTLEAVTSVSWWISTPW